MDYTLLQSWLRLPAGPWPPDHYTLLGLTPEDSQPKRVEQRVMELMDVLRRHQLRQPELVTVGMNRLAQALVCLMDADERAAYDSANGIVIANTPAQDVESALPASVFDRDESERPAAEGDSFPENTVILEFPYTVEPEPPLSLDEEPAREARPAIVQAKAIAASPPVSRRWIYRRLAVVRRCLRDWDRLAFVLANPDESLDRPAIVFELLQAIVSVRALEKELAGLMGPPGSPGGIALALIRQPTPCDTIRNLLPDQRARLAIDWRRGRSCLEAETTRLRQFLPISTKRVVRTIVRDVTHLMRNRPVLVLVGLALLSLIVATIRSSSKR